MSDVSMAIIQSAAFHEMSAMQTCTVCALWGQLKESHGSPWLVVSPTVRKKLFQVTEAPLVYHKMI